MKYRRIPYTIEAFQFDEDTYDQVVTKYDFSTLPSWLREAMGTEFIIENRNIIYTLYDESYFTDEDTTCENDGDYYDDYQHRDRRHIVDTEDVIYIVNSEDIYIMNEDKFNQKFEKID